MITSRLSRSRHRAPRTLALLTTAGALIAAGAAAGPATAAPAVAAAPLQSGQAGFARSWTGSVAVPAFPSRGGGAQPGVGGQPYAISANGRFVVAAATDGQGNAAVAVRDRRSGRQRIVAPLALGLPDPGYPEWAGIDDSGTRLVLWTFAVDDGRPYHQTSLVDLTAGTVENLGPMVPIALSADGRSLANEISDADGTTYGSGVQAIGAGGYSGGWSHDPTSDGSVSLADLAASGRCAVITRSGADTTTGNPSDGYLADLATHTERVITTGRKGTAVGGEAAAVSGDCSTVAFWTAAELVPGVGGDGVEHLFVRRLATGRTSAVLVDGTAVAAPVSGTPRVRLDTTGRQVSVLMPPTATSAGRLTVSAVPAGPTVDLTVPGLVDAVMSGDGRTALLFTGEPYEGGQLLVRERVWP